MELGRRRTKARTFVDTSRDPRQQRLAAPNVTPAWLLTDVLAGVADEANRAVADAAVGQGPAEAEVAWKRWSEAVERTAKSGSS